MHTASQLSDTDLLTTTQRLAGTSNQLFAALLEHLAEVEARGLHRTRACASLYTYCIYELRFSEDAAARRSAAAKLVRRFPAVLGAVSSGEIHLHPRPFASIANFRGLQVWRPRKLALSAHSCLRVLLFVPSPQLRCGVTGLLMLGPHLTDDNHLEVLDHARFRTKKEIAKLVRRLAPLPAVPDRIEPVGQAPPGAPRDASWAQFVESLCPSVRELPVGARPNDWVEETATAEALDAAAVETTAPARLDDPPSAYEIQFTTTAAHVELLERARALLSHRSPTASLGELHLQAMRLLVETLEKQRYGAKLAEAAPTPKRDVRGETRAEGTELVGTAEVHVPTMSGPTPHRRGRFIPAGIRRIVFERDQHRCTYFDERGVRCHETHRLEIHHREPFARGGPHLPENLALRCQAHNALAAEQDFGREHIEQKRDGCRHEPESRFLFERVSSTLLACAAKRPQPRS